MSALYGQEGEQLVCYDDERGKGDHRHVAGEEEQAALTWNNPGARGEHDSDSLTHSAVTECLGDMGFAGAAAVCDRWQVDRLLVCLRGGPHFTCLKRTATLQPSRGRSAVRGFSGDTHRGDVLQRAGHPRPARAAELLHQWS